MYAHLKNLKNFINFDFTVLDFAHLTSAMPGLGEFPLVPIHVGDEYVNNIYK